MSARGGGSAYAVPPQETAAATLASISPSCSLLPSAAAAVISSVCLASSGTPSVLSPPLSPFSPPLQSHQSPGASTLVDVSIVANAASPLAGTSIAANALQPAALWPAAAASSPPTAASSPAVVELAARTLEQYSCSQLADGPTFPAVRQRFPTAPGVTALHSGAAAASAGATHAALAQEHVQQACPPDGAMSSKLSDPPSAASVTPECNTGIAAAPYRNNVRKVSAETSAVAGEQVNAATSAPATTLKSSAAEAAVAGLTAAASAAPAALSAKAPIRKSAVERGLLSRLQQQEVREAVLPLSPSSVKVVNAAQDGVTRRFSLELAPAMVGQKHAPKVFFIFINPTSGGNKAAAFTESGVCRITMTTPYFCNMYIFDIREGKSGEKPGFLLLKAATETVGRRSSKKRSNTNDTSGNNNNDCFSSSTSSKAGGAASTNLPAFSMVNSPSATPTPAALQQRPSEQPQPQSQSQSQPHSQQPHSQPHSQQPHQFEEAAKEKLAWQLRAEAAAIEANEEKEDDVIRVLVAGGDGTVMWFASEAEAHDIDPKKIAVGVIPYGTGNDFANAFGWKQRRGLRPFDVAMRTMRSLMLRWSDARVVHHDLWTVYICLEKDGQFTRINSKTRKVEVLRAEAGSRQTSLTLVMSNYFSMGVESRIGRGFDRHRSHSRVHNMLLYGVEGVKKACFKRTLSIDETVDALIEKPGQPDEDVIFRTRNSSVTRGPLLKKSMSLVALNIPSFSAGNDIWRCSHQVGFAFRKNPFKDRAKAVVREKQYTGDGELEFLTFPSVASLGLEFACHGRARRIHQGTGPWKIFFKDLPSRAKVYFQVDGEFFQMLKPSCISIEHNRRVKVLASHLDKHLHA